MSYLKHYNHNHDALGRFSRGNSITYTSRNAKKSNQIYNTMTKKEQYYLTGGDKRDWYVRQKEYTGKNKTAVYSLITQNENKPVAFLDIFESPNNKGVGEVAIGVSKNQRGKGHANESVQKGLEWFENNKEMQQLIWGVNANNKASIELAKKNGFKRDTSWDYDKEWIAYSRKK